VEASEASTVVSAGSTAVLGGFIEASAASATLIVLVDSVSGASATLMIASVGSASVVLAVLATLIALAVLGSVASTTSTDLAGLAISIASVGSVFAASATLMTDLVGSASVALALVAGRDGAGEATGVGAAGGRQVGAGGPAGGGRDGAGDIRITPPGDYCWSAFSRVAGGSWPLRVRETTTASLRGAITDFVAGVGRAGSPRSGVRFASAPFSTKMRQQRAVDSRRTIATERTNEGGWQAAFRSQHIATCQSGFSRNRLPNRRAR
jgi:hypothetical protein